MKLLKRTQNTTECDLLPSSVLQPSSSPPLLMTHRIKIPLPFLSSAELHSAQPLPAQPLHAGAERGHGQVLLVDAEPGREARQVGAETRRLHGDLQVREATRPRQEARRGAAERPINGHGRRAERCDAVA